MGGSLKVLSLRLSSVERSFIAARSPHFSPRVWKGGASQAAEKPLQAVIPSPFAVILSAAKDLALPAQGKLREASRPAVSRQENPERSSSRAGKIPSIGM
jgi:hypothetical protein